MEKKMYEMCYREEKVQSINYLLHQHNREEVTRYRERPIPHTLLKQYYAVVKA